ncbi:MAG TPA: diguanylate cyclase [Solirubrobacteraceae bacterium]|nr:diguanylate cyclase [Solirubrobacteraceae bacterium]
MAASDPKHSTRTHTGPRKCLTPDELAVRLDEEVSRAGRHHTALSCLLVTLDEVERLSEAHGEELAGQALSYLGTALGSELRRFDRIGHAAEGELLVLLPGADERRGEIVARRALGRLHAVKIEVAGERHPLRISMGIAAWREGLTAEQLLAQTRIAAQRNGPSEPHPSGLPGEDAGEASEPPALRQS